MTFRPKLWLGVGAVALASSVNPIAAEPAADASSAASSASLRSGPERAQAPKPVLLAQGGGLGGEGGESGVRRPRKAAPTHRHVEPGVLRQERQRDKARKHRGHGGEGGEGGEHGTRGGRQGSAPAPARIAGPGGEGGERGPSRLAGSGGEGGEAGVNTRYIFGFTEGADTERAGEREIENDAIGRFGKRAGSYSAVQNKTEFEYGITKDLMVEFGSFLTYNKIRNVPDLNNRDAVNFDGIATELKYRILDRYTFPFGLAISAEPEWRRHSETSGSPEDAYGLELKLYADKEVVPGKLFIAGNLLFEPEVIRVNQLDPNTGRVKQWERESTFGVSGAITGAVTDWVFMGAEIRYIRKYEGSFLNKLEGQALHVGPTLSARILPNAVLQAAYSVQVAGKAEDEPNRRLDLVNSERHQGRLRLVVEF